VAGWKTPTLAVALLAAGVGVAVAVATGAVGIRRGDAPKSGTQDAAARADELERLESLGYSGAVEVRPEHKNKSGLTRAVEGAFDPNGLGVGTPLGWGHAYAKAGGKRATTEARLIDMTGTVVHTWRVRPKRHDVRHGWDIAKLGPDGILHAIYDRHALLAVDWDSKVVREVQGRFHHDLAIEPDGTVIVMDEQRRTLVDPVDGYGYDLLDHGFTFVAPDGTKTRSLWLHDALVDQPYYRDHLEARLAQWRPARTKRGELHQLADFMHANTVAVLQSDQGGRWRAGDLMTTIRQMDLLVVIGRDDGTLRWSWGQGVLDRPHDPSHVQGDRVMVFDNGWHAKRSRILEISARSGEIVWTYEGSAADAFFSKKRGLAQALRGGSVVINSSQNARTFEVTRDGAIVWEYFSPDMLGEFRVPMRYVRLQGASLAAARARLDAPE
jgi:hypothetical protein